MALITGLAAKAVLGKLWSKITLRGVAIFVGCLLVLWGLYSTYNWIEERGASRGKAETEAVLRPQIVELIGQRDEARAELKDFKDAYKKWADETAEADRLFKEQNELILSDLRGKLRTAQANLAKKEKLIDELETYVPAEIGAVELPVGLISLYNHSIEGRPDTGPASYAIPERYAGNAGAASGITLSEFLPILIRNNAEAVYRGRLIVAWQDWYVKNQSAFAESQQQAAATVPRLDELNTPTPPPEASSTDQVPVNGSE